MVIRRIWGARLPKGDYTAVDSPPVGVLHHSAGTLPTSPDHAMSILRAIQYQHMFTNQLAPGGAIDIAYHFMIDPFGNVYEGRPVNTRGAHAPNDNEKTGICLLGNYETVSANGSVHTALYDLANSLALDKLLGHRSVYPTACPGDNGMLLLAEVNKRLETFKKPVDFDDWPPPHGATLSLRVGGEEWKGWANANNRIVSIAVHKALRTERCEIDWRGGTWRGRTDVTNVCINLYRTFKLRYR